MVISTDRHPISEVPLSSTDFPLRLLNKYVIEYVLFRKKSHWSKRHIFSIVFSFSLFSRSIFLLIVRESMRDPDRVRVRGSRVQHRDIFTCLFSIMPWSRREDSPADPATGHCAKHHQETPLGCRDVEPINIFRDDKTKRIVLFSEPKRFVRSTHYRSDRRFGRFDCKSYLPVGLSNRANTKVAELSADLYGRLVYGRLGSIDRLGRATLPCSTQVDLVLKSCESNANKTTFWLI